MSEDIEPRFVYLTTPTLSEPTLNIVVGDVHTRYRLNRHQLHHLNAQLANALDRSYGIDSYESLRQS
jgi:hypothetical protein